MDWACVGGYAGLVNFNVYELIVWIDTWVEMMLPAMEEFVNVSLLQEWPSDEYEKMVVACGTLTVK